MASRTTAVPVNLNPTNRTADPGDWQNIDPGDWQTVNPSVPQLPKTVSVPALSRDSRGNPIVARNPDRPLSATEKAVTWPLGFESNGMTQLGRGIYRMTHPQSGSDFAGGTADLAQGGMAVATPFALPSMVASPVRAITGLGVGTAVGAGTSGGLQALGVPEGYSEAAGTATGAVAGGLAAAFTPEGLLHPVRVDPHVAALRAWGFERDPKILDQMRNGDVKLTAGLSDLKQSAAQQGIDVSNYHPDNATGRGSYANEAVLKALPKALEANRTVWQQWMDRARGQLRSGDPIIVATANALKTTLSDPRAQALLTEAERLYGGQLTPADMERLLIEKNGELASFYSGDKAVQAAAERAGADTLKNKALLQAQASAIRDLLYNTLDPEGAGARPAEIQGRYGALKAIEQAANANRTDFIANDSAAHPINPTEKLSNLHIDPRQWMKANLTSPEWQVSRAVLDSPDPNPLPSPNRPYPYQSATRPSTIGPARQLPAGTAPFTQGTSAVNPSAMMPRGPTANPYNAGLLPPGNPAQGEGVIQVPPPGAGGQWQSPSGPVAADWQLPANEPRVGAPPADTSSVTATPGATVVPQGEPNTGNMGNVWGQEVWYTPQPPTQ